MDLLSVYCRVEKWEPEILFSLRCLIKIVHLYSNEVLPTRRKSNRRYSLEVTKPWKAFEHFLVNKAFRNAIRKVRQKVKDSQVCVVESIIWVSPCEINTLWNKILLDPFGFVLLLVPWTMSFVVVIIILDFWRTDCFCSFWTLRGKKVQKQANCASF